MNRDVAIAADHDHLVNPRPCDPPQSHLNQSIAKATEIVGSHSCRRLSRELGVVKAGVLYRQSGIGASLGRPVRVPKQGD